MDQFGLPEKRIVSPDGTGIAYWISRPATHFDRGVTLAFANGIGISRMVWQDYYFALRDHYTIIFWDYRSIYRSEHPPELSRLTPPDHATDLATILDTENIARVVLVGWSMGVQVSLETWLKARQRIVGMVLLNGTGGRTFDTAFGLPGMIYWLPPVTRLLSNRFGRQLNRAMPYLFRKELVKVLITTGVVGPTVDVELLGDILDEYAKLDYGTYFHLLNNLGYHAPQHLHTIDVPVLILTGGKDAFTPPVAGKRLRDRLKNSEYEQLEEGSHYMLMEFSTWIRQRIEQFVDERVLRVRHVRRTGPGGDGGAKIGTVQDSPSVGTGHASPTACQTAIPTIATADTSPAPPESGDAQTGSSRPHTSRLRARVRERKSIHQVMQRIMKRPH